MVCGGDLVEGASRPHCLHRDCVFLWSLPGEYGPFYASLKESLQAGVTAGRGRSLRHQRTFEDTGVKVKERVVPSLLIVLLCMVQRAARVLFSSLRSRLSCICVPHPRGQCISERVCGNRRRPVARRSLMFQGRGSCVQAASNLP